MGVIFCYLHVYLWQFSRFLLQLLSKQITIIWNATKNDINFIHDMRMHDETSNWFDTGKTTIHSSELLPMDINYFLWLVNGEGEIMGHRRLWGLYLIKVPITRRSSCDTGLQTQSELTNPPRLLWWRMLLVISLSKRREVSAHSFWRSRFATSVRIGETPNPILYYTHTA